MALASAVASGGLLLADRLWRSPWDFSWIDHWLSAPILFLGPAAILGVLWAQISWINRRLTGWAGRPALREGVDAVIVGALGALAAIPAAFRTFSGVAVSRTWLGPVGPWLFLGGFFVVVSVVTLHMGRARAAVDRGDPTRAARLGAALLLSAGALLWIDMTVYIDLYGTLHSFLEFCAYSSLFAAAQLTGYVFVSRWPMMVQVNRGLGGVLVVVGTSYVASPGLRQWVDTQLSHAWVEKIYVGRTLRRMSQIELALSGGGSHSMHRIRQLEQRFGIERRDLDPAYLASSVVAPRGGAAGRPLNVVFFYVDTLRADVARDRALMPHLAAFRERAWDFENAYATGSDTLRSLPAILEGNYFLDKIHDGELLRLAEARGIASRLVIARSAHDFLTKLSPGFRFSRTELVDDLESGEEVWGYGAHRPTASALVDRSIAHLERRKETPFFLWIFHSDQHGWRELDEEYIAEQARRFGIAEPGELPFRYRVLARAIDEEFGRFLRALDASPLKDETAVVFLSDHGEGLGKGGFWVHSIFLWQELVRVPLVIAAPGWGSREVERPVSLVDLAPTIASLWGGTRGIYHGETLWSLADAPRRRFPILFRGGQFDSLDRIGMLDETTLDKFVLRVEAGYPELHALRVDPGETTNLAAQRPARVRQFMQTLGTTPVFPRQESDFLHIEQLSELDLDATSYTAEPRLDSPASSPLQTL